MSGGGRSESEPGHPVVNRRAGKAAQLSSKYCPAAGQTWPTSSIAYRDPLSIRSRSCHESPDQTGTDGLNASCQLRGRPEFLAPPPNEIRTHRRRLGEINRTWRSRAPITTRFTRYVTATASLRFARPWQSRAGNLPRVRHFPFLPVRRPDSMQVGSLLHFERTIWSIPASPNATPRTAPVIGPTSKKDAKRNSCLVDLNLV